MVGKTVIYLANLAPRKIRGVLSQGMILAAGGDEVLALSAAWTGMSRPGHPFASLAAPMHPASGNVESRFFPCFVAPRRR